MECRWHFETPMKLSSKLRLGLATLATGLLFTAATASADPITVDLITSGSGGTNNAIFARFGSQPAGSGVFDSFLRIQKQGNNTVSEGYNSDGNFEFDSQPSHTFNHSILLADVSVFNLSGVDYYGFALDINQEGNDPLLSMTSIKLFQANVGNLQSMNTNRDGWNDGASSLKWDLDSAGDAQVDMDYNFFGSGSGQTDVFMFVKTSLFDTSSNPYVYLYTKFGGVGAEPPYQDNDGYQEWSTLAGGSLGPAVPLPGIAMAGMSLFGVRWARRRRES